MMELSRNAALSPTPTAGCQATSKMFRLAIQSVLVSVLAASCWLAGCLDTQPSGSWADPVSSAPDDLSEKAENRILDKKLRIAIIGGGTAGITAGYLLTQKGYRNVTVFEKEARAGGKNLSYHHEGRVYDGGSTWFPADAKVFLEIAKANNLDVFYYDSSQVLSEDGVMLPMSVYGAKKYGPDAFKNSIGYFFGLVKQYPVIGANGFKGVDKTLFLAMDEFLSLHQPLIPIADAFQSFMTGCGYGYYGNTAAIYYLKTMLHMLNGILQAQAEGRKSVIKIKQGAQSVFLAAAENLDVIYGTEVTRVERRTMGKCQKIKITAGKRIYLFDKVIITTNPYDTVKYLDSDNLEKRILSSFKNYRFVSSFVKASNLPAINTIMIKEFTTIDKMGGVVALDRPYLDTDMAITYQIVPWEKPQGFIDEHLRKGIENVGGSLDTLVDQRNWNYFPHLDPDVAATGLFDSLEALQGQKGTFYAGGALSMETVGHVTEYVGALVSKHFE